MAKRKALRWQVWLVAVIFQWLTGFAVAAPPLPCHVTEVSAKSVTCGDTVVAVGAKDDTAKAALAKIVPGTIIDKLADNMEATDIGVKSQSIDSGSILVACVVGFIIAWLYCSIIGGTLKWPGSSLVYGLDKRLSNSKIQATAWMFIIVAAYVASLWLRFLAGKGYGMTFTEAASVGVSSDLIAIAGMSVAAAGGAKIVTGVKAAMSAPSGTAPAAAKNQPTFNEPNGLADLARNDKGDWSPSDTQMLIISLGSVVCFIWTVIGSWQSLKLSGHTDLPNPTNLVTLALGASLGGYLMKKIGGQLGEA